MRKAVLFDFDGVICDSGQVHHQAYLKSFKELGLTPPPAKYRQYKSWVPLKFEIIYKRTGIEPGSPRYNAARKVLWKYAKRDYPKAPIYSGIRQVLQELSKQGYLLAIISSTDSKIIYQVLKSKGLGKFFKRRYILSTSGGSGKKELVAKALRMFDVTPANAVVVGDSPSDLTGGLENGTRVLAVSYGMFSKKVLVKFNPDKIVGRARMIPAAVKLILSS
jgi:phosphoglycolate phosphatase-like HAD superfamily hydrolase